MHARYPAALAAFGLLFALSCGKSPDGPPPPPSGPALKIIAGAGLSDTIQAMPNQGLVAQVLGETGRPASGAVVFFDARTTGCTASYNACLRLVLSPALGRTFADTALTTTDAAGRAVVRVRLGTLAGPVAVRISVPWYGLTAAAAFTVLPGAATAVKAFLPDTTVELGGTFAARGGAVDRVGNVRSDPVTFEATSSALGVSGAGSVSALAIGRAYVRVRGTVGGTAATDSTRVMVVPKGRFAVVSGYGGAGRLSLESLAGGAVRQLVAGTTFHPAWSPSGDRIVYSTLPGLAITDTLGQVTPLATPGVTNAYSPEYSRDGLWIYFQGSTAQGMQQIFRLHPDGTGLEALQSPGEEGRDASPSPDGTRVAYASRYALLVRTIATGHVDTLVTTSSMGVGLTRWSPDGNWIAFVHGGIGSDVNTIGLIRPDGSGVRNIGGSASGGVSWSPDSKWLVAGGSGWLQLVDVTAGTSYQTTTQANSAAWHP